jgi:transposase-like protein
MVKSASVQGHDMKKRVRLSESERLEIVKKKNEGVAVTDLATEFDVSEPTIYTILKTAKDRPTQLSGIAVVEQEIRESQDRIAVLEKTVGEIERLKEEVKIKKAFLDSLRALQTTKGNDKS